MKLYNADASPFAARARLAIYKGQLPVEIVPPPEGGLKSPAYTALNPIGKLPVLVLDDGTSIPESAVILEYLADKFPAANLLPQNIEQAARARLLARMADLYLGPPGGKLFGQLNPEKRDQAVVDAALADQRKAIGLVERFLDGQGGWAIGGQFSLADCGLLPTLFYAEFLGSLVGAPDVLRGGKIGGYWTAASQDAAVAKVLGEMKTDAQKMMAARR